MNINSRIKTVDTANIVIANSITANNITSNNETNNLHLVSRHLILPSAFTSCLDPAPLNNFSKCLKCP